MMDGDEADAADRPKDSFKEQEDKDYESVNEGLTTDTTEYDPSQTKRGSP